MRIVVLIFGILGTLASGVVGFITMALAAAGPLALESSAQLGASDTELRAMLDGLKVAGRAWPFLYAGAALGLFGSILGFMRYRFSAAALFACAALGPALFIPNILVFTFCLPLAFLFSLFIRPLPTDTEAAP